MTDDQRRFLHDALTSILRAEEDPNIEQLSKEDIWEETRSMTLGSPPEPVEPRDTGEILRAPMDIKDVVDSEMDDLMAQHGDDIIPVL